MLDKLSDSIKVDLTLVCLAVCFISNGCKQQFFQQVEFFENICNTTGWMPKYKATLSNQQSNNFKFESA